ncbi:MAG TPA: thermonuclease family protein [Candidatus Nanoarchaeia archaeon]|nr:thermonuclease family protein [Candidatus Nanoarchaeia archaeon]
MKKITKRVLIYFLLLMLIAIDYPIIDRYIEESLDDYEIGVVERIVDGDTIIVNGSSVRLLGINTPEKGEVYYEEAKKFLNETIHGEVVRLRMGKEDTDLYGRKLRYVFLEERNINLEIVGGGYANFYFPSGKDKYYSDFKKAWLKCLDSNKGICEKSYGNCSLCVELRELDVENQEILIGNKCDFTCKLDGWTIKDEGRKKYTFENYTLDGELKIVVGKGDNTRSTLYWGQEDYVWTQKGDSLFIRDENNKLVLWHSY